MPLCASAAVRSIALVSSLSLLTACGGGDTESPSPASPEVTAASSSESQGDFRLRSYRKRSAPKFAAARKGAVPQPEASAAAAPDAAACDPVTEDKIYRFVEGIDTCVVPMAEAEIEAKLQDPFAVNVLRQGKFPNSVDAIVADLSTLGLTQTSYLIGEGGQVPTSVAPRDAPRNLRYVVTWGPSTSSAQILLSAAAGGDSGFHQVISWDPESLKYNFYQLIPQVNSRSAPVVWSWAGDSPMARAPETVGVGCFDCHHNGVVIMKELQVPWNNWHSERATIAPSVVPEAVANEALFKNKSGAQVLEQAIQGGFQTYYQNWLRARFDNQGGTIQLTDVPAMLRHVTTNTTLNLQSSLIQSRLSDTSGGQKDVSLPVDFLVWDSVLGTMLGLDYTRPTVIFARNAYDKFVTDHEFRLVQTTRPGYSEEGSTYFATFVPSPPAEDVFMISQLRSANIVNDKMIAAVLLVDLANPVFSTKRDSLQQYAEQVPTGTIKDGVSTVPGDFADKVRQATAGQPACDPTKIDQCTAEQQFLSIWDLSDSEWKAAATARVSAYIESLNDLPADEQVTRLMTQVVHRQQQFTTWPLLSNLHEFSLQVPETNLAGSP